MLPGLTLTAGMSPGGSAGSFWTEASTDQIQKTGSTSGGSKTLTTSSVTVTAHGGSSPYTFSWARISGSSAITATAPSAANTAFTATLSPNQELLATFRCTVTDNSGAVATVDVFVDLELVSFA